LKSKLLLLVPSSPELESPPALSKLDDTVPSAPVVVLPSKPERSKEGVALAPFALPIVPMTEPALAMLLAIELMVRLTATTWVVCFSEAAVKALPETVTTKVCDPPAIGSPAGDDTVTTTE